MKRIIIFCLIALLFFYQGGIIAAKVSNKVTKQQLLSEMTKSFRKANFKNIKLHKNTLMKFLQKEKQWFLPETDLLKSEPIITRKEE